MEINGNGRQNHSRKVVKHIENINVQTLKYYSRYVAYKIQHRTRC
jgi:hypothetical protein